MLDRVVVLGAGSIVTPYLTARLAARGLSGACHSRHSPAALPALDPAFPWQALDVAEPGSWRAPAGAGVVSLLPLWLLAPLLPRLSGIGRIIAFSSTSMETKRDSSDAAERAMVARLAAAEQALRHGCAEHGIPWTILRPTLIYSEGWDANVSAIAGVIRRFGFFPVAGAAAGLRQPVHADDVAAAAISALFTPQAADRVFVIAGGETLPYREMVRRVFESLGRPPRILSLPVPVLRFGMAVLGRLRGHGYSPALFLRMNQDMAFDDGEARAVLGYHPRPFHPDFVGRGGGPGRNERL